MSNADGQQVCALTVMPIYHYNFTNDKGLKIETTKYIAEVGKGFFIEGTSKLLNDKDLYRNCVCRGYFDGKKWVLVSF